MRIFYGIRRRILTIISTQYNKIIMFFSGILFGKRFSSCGCIVFRNFAGHGGIKIGNNVNVNSGLFANPVWGSGKTVFFTGSNGHIEIGNKVGISNAILFSDCKIVIGNEAVIGSNCKIYDTDFHSTISEYRQHGNINVPCAPVTIGARAFIGAGAIILKGVNIGEDAVVGAGAVVTHDIPEREIWAGNPARFIKKVTIDKVDDCK